MDHLFLSPRDLLSFSVYCFVCRSYLHNAPYANVLIIELCVSNQPTAELPTVGKYESGGRVETGSIWPFEFSITLERPNPSM